MLYLVVILIVMEYNIQHNIAEQRFEVIIDGLMSEVTYKVDPEGNLRVIHSGVPRQLEGRGIAAALTKSLLEYAKGNSLKVIPVCPYTRAYIERHPEYKELVL